jgi:hypothetical protein
MPEPSRSATRRSRLNVECLEDRTVPTFLPATPSTISFNGVVQPVGGLSLAAGNLFPNRLDPLGFGNEMQYVTGTGPGVDSLVRVWDSQTGALLSSFSPFQGFRGGVNVAVGDVLGLGKSQIVVTPASNGPPIVAVFNANGTMLSEFFVNGNTTFMGGLNVAVGHVLGGISAGGFNDGLVSKQFPEQIIVTTATQFAFVVVTDGSGNTLQAFDVAPGFTGGLTVAAANTDATRLANFTFGGNVPDTNAYDEIIVGAASQLPAVAVFSVWQGGATPIGGFFAFDPTIHQGVTLAAGPTATTHQSQIFVSQVGTSTVRSFDGADFSFLGEVTVYPTDYSHVVNMAVGWFTPGGYDPSDDDTTGFDNFDFYTQDLAVVAGDGPYQQQPRYFIGLPFSAAGLNGPPP